MTTTTVTENISNISSILEKVSLPTDVIPTLDATIDKAPKYTKVPGGFEVEHKGYKWFTGTIPNPDYVPPKDFTYPPNYDELPLNPDGQIELPQKLVADYTDYEFEHLLANITVTDDPPLEKYDHIDCASRADPEKKSLFAAIKSKKDMTPTIGTEVTGVQLSSLTDAQKDELSLWTAERGLIVFRDQDFVHQSPEFMKQFGSHFGRLHVHSFSTHVKGHPEILANLRDSDQTVFDRYSRGMLTTVRWHSDMTYEPNPMGTTILCALSVPETGGDTLYLNAMEAYDRLSPHMQTFLEGLDALHSGARQSVHGRAGSVYRQQLVDSVHPIVRRHPVTGRKALWFNPEYVTGIVQLRDEESDAIMKMLFAHIRSGLDFHTRVKWESGTVAVYDNRMVMHSVCFDYPVAVGEKRHHIRLTPQAERPILARDP